MLKADTILGKLRAIRLGRGLTLTQVADALHVTPQAVSYWELGRNDVRLSLLLRYCEFLGVHIELDTKDGS